MRKLALIFTLLVSTNLFATTGFVPHEDCEAKVGSSISQADKDQLEAYASESTDPALKEDKRQRSI